MILTTTRVQKDSRSAGYLQRHLLDKVEQNEAIELISGTREDFELMRKYAKAADIKYAFRHISISPKDNENIKNVDFIINDINKTYGIEEGRLTILVKHKKQGREHFHYVAAEYNPDNEKVLDSSFYKYKNCEISQRFNEQFGETIHPLISERKAEAVPHISPIQRQKAERVEPEFNAGKLASAYATGISALKAEMKSQGIRAEKGDKKIILVNSNNEMIAAFDRTLKLKKKEFEEFYLKFEQENSDDIKFNFGEIKHEETIIAPKTENISITSEQTNVYSFGDKRESNFREERYAEGRETEQGNKPDHSQDVRRSSVNGGTIERTNVINFKQSDSKGKTEQRLGDRNVRDNNNAAKFYQPNSGNVDRIKSANTKRNAEIKKKLILHNVMRLITIASNRAFDKLFERKSLKSRLIAMRSMVNDNLEKANENRYKALNLIPNYWNPPKAEKPKLSLIVNNGKDKQSDDYTPPNMKF